MCTEWVHREAIVRYPALVEETEMSTCDPEEDDKEGEEEEDEEEEANVYGCTMRHQSDTRP